MFIKLNHIEIYGTLWSVVMDLVNVRDRSSTEKGFKGETPGKEADDKECEIQGFRRFAAVDSWTCERYPSTLGCGGIAFSLRSMCCKSFVCQ